MARRFSGVLLVAGLTLGLGSGTASAQSVDLPLGSDNGGSRGSLESDINRGWLPARGSRGETVRELQRRLAALGFSSGTVDGVFGPKLANAVRRFQRSRGLDVDGVVGSGTLKALQKAERRAAERAREAAVSASEERERRAVSRSPRPVSRPNSGRSSDGVNGAIGSEFGIGSTRGDGRFVLRDGDPLVKAINDGTVLKTGSSGPAVSRLREVLNRLGYEAGTGDRFDRQTRDALRDFQRYNGTSPDGAAGRGTLKALRDAAAVGDGRPSDVPVTRRAGGEFVQQNPDHYQAELETAARRHGLNVNLLKALIQAESHWDPAARSETGADGLGQFTGVAMKEVRRQMGLGTYADRYRNDTNIRDQLRNFNTTAAYRPRIAIEATAFMLATLLEKYDGNEEAALTYYNAGGNMAAHVRRYGHAEARRRGLLTFSQSSTYAPKVLRYKRKFDAGWHPEQDD